MNWIRILRDLIPLILELLKAFGAMPQQQQARVLNSIEQVNKSLAEQQSTSPVLPK